MASTKHRRLTASQNKGLRNIFYLCRVRRSRDLTYEPIEATGLPPQRLAFIIRPTISQISSISKCFLSATAPSPLLIRPQYLERFHHRPHRRDHVGDERVTIGKERVVHRRCAHDRQGVGILRSRKQHA